VVGVALLALLALALVLPPIALTLLIGVLLLAAYVELGRVLGDLAAGARRRADPRDALLLALTQLLGAGGRRSGSPCS
jgi:hypothetical protein